MIKIPSRNSLFERVKSLGKRYGGGFYDAAANFERTRRKRVAMHKRQMVAATGYTDFSAVVGAIAEMADAQAYAEVLALSQAATKTSRPGEEAQFIRDFAQLAVAVRVSAYDEAARYADKILATKSPSLDDLAKILDQPSYERLAVGIANALTRVGRYPDAKAFLSAHIVEGENRHRLFKARAEIAWPHDPDLAMSDLIRLIELDYVSPGDALLYAYLQFLHPDSPLAVRPTPAGDVEMPLVRAMRARRAGDTGTFANELNSIFTMSGLTAPVPGTAAFSYKTLSSDAPSVEKGPLVSVIMTTFNAEATLGYAVRSILKQSYRNLELFIVDDVSTDGTRAMLADIERQDPRVRVVLNETNGGTYVAKNRAMQLAKGAFVTFHDSDDWAHPQRIERHVAAMESNPETMVWRSNWVRVTSDGVIDVCRWGKRIIHPNPASMFMRREVIDRIGYFDSVRVSADTEYRLRARTVFGSGAVQSLREVLAVGALHAASLTQSGAGALNVDKYSQPRSAYASAYWKWYINTPVDKLYIGPEIGLRPFPAPASILPDPALAERINPVERDGVAVTPLVFGISLASKQVSSDWARTTELLGHTLESLLAQTDPRFAVIICGHEKPELGALSDPRIRFIATDAKPPTDPRKYRTDKMRKRRLIGAALRELGGGYFFPLDADDLVHKDVVRHVRETDNKRGYAIMSGYALDYAAQKLAPIPGVWSTDYNRVCGSSALIYFEPDELPVDGENEEELYFNLFQSHAYWPVLAEEYGRKLDPLPFAAGVYVLNHSQNLSFGLQRRGPRTDNIIASVERNALADGTGVLRDQFGWKRSA
ncbi:MAG: glycosyltransferase family A protein [Devosia sp.]